MLRDEKPVGVAVLGLGNVGSEVVRIIEDSADDLAARVGAPLVLRGVGVRRVAARPRCPHRAAHRRHRRTRRRAKTSTSSWN